MPSVGHGTPGSKGDEVSPFPHVKRARTPWQEVVVTLTTRRSRHPTAVRGQRLRDSRRPLDPLRFGLAAVSRLAGSPALDRLRLRRPTERAVFTLTRTGFSTATAASRTFVAARGRTAATRLATSSRADLFDLNPTDEQRMLTEVVREFAAEQIRPAAPEADAACRTPDHLLAAAAELGTGYLGVPEELGGLATERSTVTNALVAEALAHGDLGIAVACLAPAAVSGALSQWGSAHQQATYLPSFTGKTPPAAALALLEPRPVFDPLQLRTHAVRTPAGYRLDGVKSLVPLASQAELFVVGAQLEGHGPALFVVESSTAGLVVTAEPAMGVRAAGMGRLLLQDVVLPPTALITGGDSAAASNGALSTGGAGGGAGSGAGAGSVGDDPYVACVRLSRLAWCALAVGTAQAVLDHVIPYVNAREAFGEPISHKQAVAFTVAEIATELAGMRLVTYRAAARAQQGLPYARETALARQLCTERAMAIGSSGVQLLGGHGYVKEHPVERWYRDLRAVGVMEGAVLV